MPVWMRACSGRKNGFRFQKLFTTLLFLVKINIKIHMDIFTASFCIYMSTRRDRKIFVRSLTCTSPANVDKIQMQSDISTVAHSSEAPASVSCLSVPHPLVLPRFTSSKEEERRWTWGTQQKKMPENQREQ